MRYPGRAHLIYAPRGVQSKALQKSDSVLKVKAEQAKNFAPAIALPPHKLEGWGVTLRVSGR